MLKIEKTSVYGFEEAIRGMRNPSNSWDKSDSGICKGGNDGVGCSNCAAYDCGHTYDNSFQLGKNDFELMTKLCNAGTDHRKFMRMIAVYVDITAPLYWWKEFDTYKVGTVANSCSTMHKIAEKKFTLEDFSCEHIISDWVNNNVESFVSFGDTLNVEPKVSWSHGKEYNLNGGVLFSPKDILSLTIHSLNACRRAFLTTKDKKFWWQMIQLLPSSYNQKRTVMLNYEVLANIYKSRHNHKLDEWREFCCWIETLLHSELITGLFVMKKDDSWIDKFNAVGNVNPISPNDLKIGIDLANGKDFTSNEKENVNG